MKRFFCKIFTPWKAASFFETEEEFFRFLARKNKQIGSVRAVFLVIAAAMLMISYAFDRPLFNYIAVGCLVVALAATLLIRENEKQLPEQQAEKV